MSSGHVVTLALGECDSALLLSLCHQKQMGESEVLKCALSLYSSFAKFDRRDRELILHLSEQKGLEHGDLLKRALWFYSAFEAAFSHLMNQDK